MTRINMAAAFTVITIENGNAMNGDISTEEKTIDLGDFFSWDSLEYWCNFHEEQINNEYREKGDNFSRMPAGLVFILKKINE